METNEAEVLVRAFYDGGNGETHDAATRAGVLAVAAKARELDAARGGTLSVEDVRRIRRDTASGKALSADDGRGLALHSAAQGRTIAGLEREARAEMDGKLDTRRVHGARDEETYRMFVDRLARERDEARATIAAKDARIEALEAEHEEDQGVIRVWRGRTERAESAMATLRQAVQSVLDALALEAEDTPEHAATMADARDGLAQALDATPAEHPDTAALRAIRERAKKHTTMGRIACNAMAVPEAEDADVGHAVARYVLGADNASAPSGDSGPSRGGETCDCWQKNIACIHVVTRRLPTTPPDVAASEDADMAAVQAMTDEEVDASLRAHGVDPEAFVERTRRHIEKVRAKAVSAPTPTPEEDWRTLRDLVNEYVPAHSLERGRAALARLTAEPRRAAERMRGKADVAVLMLQPPASLLRQCKTTREDDMMCSAWTSAINAALGAIRDLEVTQ